MEILEINLSQARIDVISARSGAETSGRAASDLQDLVLMLEFADCDIGKVCDAGATEAFGSAWERKEIRTWLA